MPAPRDLPDRYTAPKEFPNRYDEMRAYEPGKSKMVATEREPEGIESPAMRMTPDEHRQMAAYHGNMCAYHTKMSAGETHGSGGANDPGDAGPSTVRPANLGTHVAGQPSDTRYGTHTRGAQSGSQPRGGISKGR